MITIYLKDGHQRDQRENELLTAVANSLAGIIQRKKAEEALQRLLDRENLLANISSYFLVLSPQEVDEGINQTDL